MAAVLLCAGRSTRFGAGDKLMAPLRGMPLAAHAADRLASLPLRWRIAVVQVGKSANPLRALLSGRGFALVDNDRPEDGQDVSLRLGIGHALTHKPRAILVCLGDMPDVGLAYLSALAAAADDETAAIGWTGDWQSPPLILPAGLAKSLLAQPHRRVREILTSGDVARVPASARELRDYDTSDDFAGK